LSGPFGQEQIMEAFVQLALMAKAKRVFESDDTFLSFRLLSPWTVDADRLRFYAGEMTQQRIADLSEFSRMTNCIPTGVVAPEEQGEYLWDIYREVLDTAEIAAGTMTEQQRARYDRAGQLLYVTGPDGLRQDSPVLEAYRQHRDSHIAAVEEYKNRQLTAESSEDPAVKAAWVDDEPLLRDAVDQRMKEWRNEGRKGEVEAALRTEEAHAAREPSLIWDQWRTSFSDDLDISTDLSNQDFAVTGFSPYDVFDQGEWPSFTLTRDEMTKLTAEPPHELTQIFGDQVAGEDVESVSFEYRSVAITRPWFRPPLFRARFWRLGSEGGELSDGAAPPEGYCPAYVTGLVFARNVTVKRRAQPETPAEGAQPIGEMLRLDAGLLSRAQALQKVTTPVAFSRRLAPPAGEEPAMGRHTVLTSRVNPAGLAAAVRTGGTRDPAGRPRPRLDVAARLRGAAFVGGVQPVIVPPTPTPTQPEPTTEPVTPSNQITVLAFVCKRLPRCPDPDPSLRWS
jgi:hypothetical protein